MTMIRLLSLYFYWSMYALKDAMKDTRGSQRRKLEGPLF